MDRPEYVRCILDEPESNKRGARFTICGRQLKDLEHDAWDVGHWLFHTLQGGRYLACADCGKALRDAVDRGIWDGKP